MSCGHKQKYKGGFVMLLKDLIIDCMSRRNLSLHNVAALTEINEKKVKFYLDGAVPTDKDLIKICEGLKLDENDITYDELNISINECAKLMCTGPLFVRNAIEKKRLPGACVETKGKKKFHIPRLAFYTYMGMQSNPHVLEAIDIIAEALKKTLPTNQSKSV